MGAPVKCTLCKDAEADRGGGLCAGCYVLRRLATSVGGRRAIRAVAAEIDGRVRARDRAKPRVAEVKDNPGATTVTATLARNLRRLREQKGLTQATLGAELGVGLETIHRWETNKSTPALAMVERIIKVLGVKYAELLGEGR